MSNLSKRSTVYFEPNIHTALTAKAAFCHCSISYLVNEAVTMQLIEDQRWDARMQTHGDGLYEVRTNLQDRRIGRVLFCTHSGHMVLLHGFVKKSQKTPKSDLDLAKKRKREVVHV